jgi:hypothetical protein
MITTPEMLQAGMNAQKAHRAGDAFEGEVRDILTAALALIPGEQKQFLPTEDGEFNGNVSIVPPHCSGYSFVFEPGVLHVKKDGSGYIVVNEEDFVLEDDRTEGPDGPEGSVHWIVRLDPSEIVALRDFLNGAPALLPVALKEWVDALERELKPLDDLPPSIQSQANIRLINSARALIRSALSSPVGTEETFTRAQMLAEVERRVERALLAKRLVGEARAEFEAENVTPASDIAALREEIIAKPFCVLFLDGRNEHGAHVLPGFPRSFDIQDDDVHILAEAILLEAERLGFIVGQDHVWANFHFIPAQIGDEGRVEYASYWDFAGINVEMSKAINAPLRSALSQQEESRG